MTDSLITDPNRVPEEQQSESSLRPQVLDEFVGQEGIKENLRVFIQAAKQRQELADHGSCPHCGKAIA